MQYVFTATKNRIYLMVQIKRVSLTEKFMICLINKCSSILYFSHKANVHNCIEMKYNYLDVIKYYVMLQHQAWQIFRLLICYTHRMLIELLQHK